MIKLTLQETLQVLNGHPRLMENTFQYAKMKILCMHRHSHSTLIAWTFQDEVTPALSVDGKSGSFQSSDHQTSGNDRIDWAHAGWATICTCPTNSPRSTGIVSPSASMLWQYKLIASSAMRLASSSV